MDELLWLDSNEEFNLNTLLFIVSQVFVLGYFFLKIKKYREFIILIPLINILVDCFTFTAEAGSVFAIWRGLIQYGFFLVVLIKGVNLKPISKLIFALMGYWLVLVLMSSKLDVSFRVYSAVCLSLIMFPVGYSCIKTFKDLTRLYKWLIAVLIVFCGYSVLSNFTEIGYTQYMKGNRDVIGVGWADAQLYSASFIIVLYPLLSRVVSLNKLLINGLMVFAFLILVISLRRSAVAIVLLGYIMFFFQMGKLRGLLKYVIPVAILVVGLFVGFEEQIMERVALREDKFSSEYDVTEEKRYFETILVWTDIAEYDSFFDVLFGKELFNSRGNYGGGALGERVIHIDYNLIAHGSGIIGLILYLAIYGMIISESLKLSSVLKKYGLYSNENIRALHAMIITFAVMSFVVGLSGQLATPTFRVITFLHLGASFSILRNQVKLAQNER